MITKSHLTLRTAQILDALHWPIVGLLIMGWAIVSDPVWLGLLGGTVALQAYYMGCPLTVLTSALRRRHDPCFERHGRSLIALAFRAQHTPRLIGATIAFAALLAPPK